MARFTSILIACAIAIVSVSACVINTPQAPKDVLQVGKPFTVTFSGCKGVNKSVLLRNGEAANLKTVHTPACAHVDLSTNSCTFTPTKAGNFAFSVEEEGATEPAYTAFFKIAPAPAAKAVAAKSSEDTVTTPADKGPVTDAAKGPATDAAKGPVPASPKGPAPVLAGKAPQPMVGKKPETKMVPSSTSKAEAVRKANTKRALYDIAAFAL
ncbi:hypothetical protein BG000_006545 [Podila horticola]|nr:hypothetical protein BG000_006545 [Podila horticola]